MHNIVLKNIFSGPTLTGSLDLSDILKFDLELMYSRHQDDLGNKVRGLVGKGLLESSFGRAILPYLALKYFLRITKIYYFAEGEKKNDNFIVFLSYSRQHSKLMMPYIDVLTKNGYRILMVMIMTRMETCIHSLPKSLRTSINRLQTGMSWQFYNTNYHMNNIDVVLDEISKRMKVTSCNWLPRPSLNTHSMKSILFGKVLWKILFAEFLLQTFQSIFNSLGYPKSIIICHDRQIFGRVISLYATRHAIPTLLLQHGLFMSKKAIPEFFADILAERIGVWGDTSKRIFVQNTKKPVKIIGSAFYKEWYKYYKDLNLSSREKSGKTLNILFLMHPPYDREINQAFLNFSTCLHERNIANRKIKCAFKIHRNALANFRDLLNISLNRMRVIGENEELLNLLMEYDIVITYPSTGILDACVSGRVPLIYVPNLKKDEYLLGLQELSFVDSNNLLEHVYRLCHSRQMKEMLKHQVHNYLCENLDLGMDPYEKFIEFLS